MAYNISRYQHSIISGAIKSIDDRTDIRYKRSPLLGHMPDLPKVNPGVVFLVDFTSGIPKDIAKNKLKIIGNNNPSYKNNSPFNGFSLYVPVDSNSMCYISYDRSFIVNHPVYIDAWVYIDNIKSSGTNQIMSSMEGGNISLCVENGYLKGYAKIGGSVVSIASTVAFRKKVWTYVAFSYNGERLALYEGLDEYIAGATGNINLADASFLFGGYVESLSINTDYALDGYIAYAGMGRRGKIYREVEKYLKGL